MSDIEFKMTGDWKKANKILGDLADKLDRAAELSLRQAVLIVERIVVQHFQNQDLGWAGHKHKSYTEMKAKKGFSTAILIMTSTLMNSITTKIREPGVEGFVGVLRGAGGSGGKDGVMIGAVHEYGSAKRGIPPRPYLRPSLEEAVPEIEKRYRINFGNVLKGRT